RNMSEKLSDFDMAPKPQTRRPFNSMQSMLTKLHLNYSLRFSFSALPPRLVEKVFTFLSAPDQICFGLSCKYILCCLKSYLEEQKTQLYQFLPVEKRKDIFAKIEQQPRVQLLLRLESDRWRYCSDCQVLHPAFTWRSLRDLKETHTKQSKCCSACSFLKGSLRCMPYAGEVDICPCTKITFVDKLNLIRLCKKEKRFVPVSNGKSSSVPPTQKPYKDFQHSCVFNANPSFRVRIRTDLLFDDTHQRLCLYNFYEIYTVPGCPLKSLRSITICPHRDIVDFARQIFHEGGSGFMGWEKNRSTRSAKFSSWARYENAEGCYYSMTISTARDLGKSDWPDKAWTRQSSRRNTPGGNA
ncbi:hypothetical protein BO79DRAFT_146743, partial [Aspergillus costaricaensis CBS 115574]